VIYRDTEVLYNEGDETIYSIPTDRHGRPRVLASCTYFIEHVARAETAADRFVEGTEASPTAATVDTVSTTTTAAVGPGSNARSVTLTSAAGVSENHYYLLEGGGNSELVLVEDVSGSTVYFRFGVSREFASGATFKGIEVSGTFPAAEADDEDQLDLGGGPYRTTWLATIDGFAERWTTWQRVVRRSSTVRVMDRDVLMRDPGLRAKTGERVRLETCIQAAWQDYRDLLKHHGRNPDLEHTDATLAAVAFRAAWYARIQMPGEKDERMAERWEAEWNRYTANLTTGQVPHGHVRLDKAADESPHDTSKEYESPTVLS